jgi:DNA-binding NtrC family response regulator
VQVCQRPQDAVLSLKENLHQIDLVITDLNMPLLNGIELAAELVRINPGLPVVLTSFEMSHLTPKKFELPNIRAFVSKPWNLKQLFATIEQALSSKESEKTQ